MRIFSQIILFFLYHLFITPISLALLIFGKRPLSLKKSSKVESYWIEVKRDHFDMENMF